MSPTVTLADVARAAGVSPQTVSRVLHGSSAVREQTRARVLAAVRALEYQPNLAARSLAAGGSDSVGVVIAVRLYHGVAATFDEVARSIGESGGDLIVASADPSDPRSVAIALQHLQGHSVPVIILISQESNVPMELARVGTTTPVVALLSGNHEIPGITTVQIDQGLGSRLATEHLLKLGRTDLLHVAGDISWQDAVERLAGYRSTCRSHGIGDRWITTNAWDPAGGYRIGMRLVANGLPEGIVAGNDDIAFGLMRAFNEAGVHVPDDVAVVGFDDIPEAAWSTPSLTSIVQDFAALGRTAVDVARSATATGKLPDPVLIAPTLIVRESTGVWPLPTHSSQTAL